MARIDTHFEAFLAERQQSGLSPKGERLFRDAWTAFRRLPGSYRADGAAVGAMLTQGRRWGRHDSYRLARGLVQILTWLRAHQHIPASTALVPPLPRSVYGPHLLTEGDIARLLRAIDDPGIRTLAYLVYHTGLKAQTLIGLKKEQVSLATRSLTLPGRDGGPDVVLRLSDPACIALRLWFLRRRQKALYLFHDATTMPLTLRSASHALREAGTAAHRPGIGFGRLQYAHLRLLALKESEVDQALIESRLQQPFRLAHLRLPNLLFLADAPFNPQYVLSLTTRRPS
ncbi:MULTISPECIES: hypothetical protein [Deinococcus]|uniref:Tyr recombinase domain-containing protein n=1 Tax=Deinococcus rufus TaxID=2136097 RepID=A0ABV7ZAE2_9DEIO|nr:hypothetical protein [Deinococcus sp. AB2017081]WQE94984.1 hypothetical protein U2P90_16570 [Deinococcus sp. AB2017081]